MRDGTRLRRAFEQAGFTLARQRVHQIWRCPCGHAQLSCPATPGKGRSIANTQADIARTLRACEPQPMKECA